MGKIKIMVIDDDSDFLSEVEEILDSNGYKTLTTPDGANAAKLAEQFEPDLILLDIKLKGTSGLVVYDELKKSSRTSKIPVIAVSGVYTKKSGSGLIKTYGIKNYISKPFYPSYLLYKIEDLLKDKMTAGNAYRKMNVEMTKTIS